MNTLQFQWATRKSQVNRHERHYLDYIIAGQSLLEKLGLAHLDKISPFGWQTDKAYQWERLNDLALSQQAKQKPQRAILYVCPECGDIDCGVITAQVLDLGNRIVWKDFGYETSYAGLIETYPTAEPIELDREPYFKALLSLGHRLMGRYPKS